MRSGKLPKIVGLDPAGVLFSVDKPDERLNSNDATYVETVQTSKLGFFDPIGKVSFYPNGGVVQVKNNTFQSQCPLGTTAVYPNMINLENNNLLKKSFY